MCIHACLLLMSTQVYANPIEKYFSNVKTLRASFVQTLFDQNKKVKEQSHGIITVQRPDKFHLEYVKPYRLLYVADGKRLWTYDEDLEQVTVKRQAGLLNSSPAMILSNPQMLTDAYTIKLLVDKDGLEQFELIPKNTESNFEKIILGFADKKLKIMWLLDSFGQTTTLEFKDLQRNPIINRKLFQFKPPKGVDVITDSGL